MVHPLLHLIATRPQLLAEHAEAYADLVGAELADASSAWKRRAVLNAAALCAMGVAAVLAGVAAMLWAVTPTAQLQSPWALVLTPAVPAVAALVCLWAAHPGGEGSAFAGLRRQLKADVGLLRDVGGAA